MAHYTGTLSFPDANHHNTDFCIYDDASDGKKVRFQLVTYYVDGEVHLGRLYPYVPTGNAGYSFCDRAWVDGAGRPIRAMEVVYFVENGPRESVMLNNGRL